MENFICNQYGEGINILNTENIIEATKMQFVRVFFHICRKFEFLISQDSVATCLRWGGCCSMAFIANFIRFPTVQKFWKSVKIWQRYRQFKGVIFLRHTVVWLFFLSHRSFEYQYLSPLPCDNADVCIVMYLLHLCEIAYIRRRLSCSFLLWGFSPCRGDTLHRWGWNLAPSSMPNFTPIGATTRV